MKWKSAVYDLIKQYPTLVDTFVEQNGVFLDTLKYPLSTLDRNLVRDRFRYTILKEFFGDAVGFETWREALRLNGYQLDLTIKWADSLINLVKDQFDTVILAIFEQKLIFLEKQHATV